MNKIIDSLLSEKIALEDENANLSKVIFQKIVKCVDAGLDNYECGTLEVEIE